MLLMVLMLIHIYVYSQTSELYDMLSHDGLHNRAFIETIFASQSDPAEKKLDRLHDLYRKSLVLFSYVCPCEYGITAQEKVGCPAPVDWSARLLQSTRLTDSGGNLVIHRKISDC